VLLTIGSLKGAPQGLSATITQAAMPKARCIRFGSSESSDRDADI
jgi:hypothetical protein